MKNMKKTLIMCISLFLMVAVAIGGTVAYLTVDPQEKGNVFSVGNIAINLTEDVGTTGAATVTSDNNGATYENVMPGDYLKKEVSVKNTGSRPAFVAVEVTINNALEINKAIDEFYEAKGYTEAEIQQIYDYIFDGFGMNYTKTDANGNATGMRLTITGDKMPEKVLQVDSVKTISEYWLQYSGNWFMDTDTVIPYDGYYTTGMNDYELRYTYYHYLEKDEKTVLFKGLNVPKEFNAQQLAMFENMNIKVVASAIQADSFVDAKDAVGTIALDDDANLDKFIAGAKEAFTVLNRVNNGEEMDLKFVSKWDGTVDTTWYDPANPQTEYKLSTAAQLAGLAKLVDDGNTFQGKTLTLDKDVDLASLAFNPIGHSSNGKSFNGTFDGQGHTISNMYEQSDLSAWQYEGEYYGLFAYTNGATIKNVTIADAYISSGKNEAAGIVGNAVNTTFSDITISNTTLIAYNNSAGGVAAECYGNCSFTNITVDEDTVIGPLWGTYDVRLGGVVGLVHAGNNVTLSNVTVACQLDAINDVAANYQYWLYRYSGMLIGHVDGVNGVADPTGYVTCENVKVIYGDWVNYHYCEDADLGEGSYNGPGEYKYARVEAGTGTNGIDLSACNHNDDESHNVLIEFDQLFGGGQGVKGLKTYDGVKVVYNNK